MWANEAPVIQVLRELPVAKSTVSTFVQSTKEVRNAVRAGKGPVAVAQRKWYQLGFLGLLLMLVVLMTPVWVAVELLMSFGYIFWFGPQWPEFLIMLVVGLVVVYIIFAFGVAGCGAAGRPSDSAGSAVVMGTVAIMGGLLLCISLPIGKQAMNLPTVLDNQCSGSEQAQRLFEYSSALRNIRMTPGCLGEQSVVDCEGYVPAEPYASYLRYMEDNLLCSGFCAPQQQITLTKEVPSEPQVLAPGPPSIEAPRPPIGPLPPTRPNSEPAREAPVPPPRNPNSPVDTWAPRPPGNVRPRRPSMLQVFANLTAQARVSPDLTIHPVMRTEAGPQDYPSFRPPSTFPMPLFGSARVAATCDGMGVKDTVMQTGLASRLLFDQGMVLVLSSVGYAFLQVLAICFEDKDDM
mmetsp:Transcript_42264/g.101699  ORF Transcript_42264/g.101699 Transcript_42264/m.101699 type:complete len:406 (-) Transcript_42264:45-1262(-)